MNVPQHIVLFPDGNRRWAKQKGLNTLEGHKKGYENLLDFAEWCKNRGVKHLTVFGFTSENWDRGQTAVNFLLSLFEKLLSANLEKYLKTGECNKIGVRIRVIGQIEKLPKSTQRLIEKLEEACLRIKKACSELQ